MITDDGAAFPRVRCLSAAFVSTPASMTAYGYVGTPSLQVNVGEAIPFQYYYGSAEAAREQAQQRDVSSVATAC